MAQQHAVWISQAKEHLREHRPQEYKRLQEAGKLDEHLRTMADLTSETLREAMAAGAKYQEAWEEARVHLFPEPEKGSEPPMPATEGYLAQRELMAGMANLQMPGEKEE